MNFCKFMQKFFERFKYKEIIRNDLQSFIPKRPDR